MEKHQASTSWTPGGCAWPQKWYGSFVLAGRDATGTRSVGDWGEGAGSLRVVQGLGTKTRFQDATKQEAPAKPLPIRHLYLPIKLTMINLFWFLRRYSAFRNRKYVPKRRSIIQTTAKARKLGQ